MLAVIFQFVDGFADVVECEMAFTFGEAWHDLRCPEICKYLQCADIEIPIMEIVVKFRHIAVDETAVLADAVSADGTGLRWDVLRDEIECALFGFGFRDAL